MTEKKTVHVEWALQGKTLGRAGKRVLACSSGSLNMDNFTEVIGRFSLGTPDKLPQVSVSYLTSGTGPDRVYYLGMAIHRWASDVQTDGGELLESDDDNRPVGVTTYFCAPYQPLAEAGVSYQAMYEKYSEIRLGTTSGPPRDVKLPVRTRLPAIDSLAMQSAARLLTDSPVCVLGAESASLAERLDFIGAVAALLPYGFRTRLTAATWIRSTHRDHRFRLYFSDAARDVNPPDHVVYWERPERTALTSSDGLAYAYDRWLTDTVGQLQVLSRLTTPRSFSSPEEVQESLDEIGVPHRPGPVERPLLEQTKQRPALPPASRDVKLEVEQLLYECARLMRVQHLSGLNTAVTQLNARAKSGISLEARDQYREIIRKLRLFCHDKELGGVEVKLRKALFKVAFDSQLSYPDYCLIEDSTGTESPDRELLQMIVDAGMSDIDIKIMAVAYGQLLSGKDTRKKLDRWYASGNVSAYGLVNAAAGGWYRPRHAFPASLIAADFMSRFKCEYPGTIRNVLQHHSYLTRMLQEFGDESSQVYVLNWFLKTAYPDGFSEGDIRQILVESAEPPSQALLAAILLLLNLPDDARLALKARRAYVFRATLAMDLEPDILTDLRSRFALIDGRPGAPAAGRGPHHAAGHS